MRQLGTLPDERAATRLGDYLLTLGIETRVDQAADGWAVWVLNEDRLPQAREELAAFLEKPDDPRYAAALRDAETVRNELARKHAAARRNTIQMRDRWTAVGTARNRPLTTALIVISVLVSLSTNFGKTLELRRFVSFVDIHQIEGGQYAHRTDLRDIEHGQVWRLFTPIFLHYDVLHLLFNMLMLYSVGGVLEMRYGTRWLAVLIAVLAPVSNLGEFLGSGSVLMGGMSGVVYGLFGYIWIKSRFDPDSRLFISPMTVFWLLAWFVVCLTGAMGNVANWAHGVGLVAGAAMAYLPLAWRRR